MSRPLRDLVLVLVGIALLGCTLVRPTNPEPPGPPAAQEPRIVFQAWNGNERMFVLPISASEARLEYFDGKRGIRAIVTPRWEAGTLQRLYELGVGPGFTRFGSDGSVVVISALGHKGALPSRTLDPAHGKVVFGWLSMSAATQALTSNSPAEAVSNEQIGAEVYAFLSTEH